MQTVIPNVSPEIERFLSSDPVKMYVGGRWTNADDGDVFDVFDPGNGVPISTVVSAKSSDVDRAVQAARVAFKNTGWSTIPANDRAVVLHRLADLIEKHRDLLARIESLNVGKPLGQAQGDVSDAIGAFRFYADLSVHTRRREPIAISGFEVGTLRVPYGVCAFIVPWNFPFAIMCQNISAALAAGNTVVVKPAEDAPLSSLFFCKLVEEAGIPPGVINIVPGFGGTAGAALSKHPNIKRMSFTGSPEVGRLVAEESAKNYVPVKLELGGKGAAVIFEDANVDVAAKALAVAITRNSGQICCTATRWIIQDKIMDKFLDTAIGSLKEIGQGIGYGLDPKTKMGPLISKKQRDTVLSYLDRGESEGAKPLLEGGEAIVSGHEGGYYVKPVLLTGTSDNICAREEIFGPVAFVMPFEDEGGAIEMVNDTNYGLGNSVWSNDLARANRVAESMVAGTSWINAHNSGKEGIPFLGCNMSGFGGGILGADTLLDYLRPQSIVRPLK